MAELRECPRYGRTNNVFVNPDRCYACGYEWVETTRVENATGGV